MSGGRDGTDARAPATGASTGRPLMQRLDPLVRAWERQFLNRALPHALQQPDGSYRWVFRRCDAGALRDHLAGEATIAISSLSARGTCRWVCLDADAADGLEHLRMAQHALAADGLPGLLEVSRRGGHLWLFFARAVPAALARGAIGGLLDQLVRAGELPGGRQGLEDQDGHEAGGLEIGGLRGFELYPDHDGAQGRLGHAVRLPLGVHRRTGERYPIIDAADRPLPLTTPYELLDCMEVVLRVPRIEQARLAALAAQVGAHAPPPAVSTPAPHARPVRSGKDDGLDLISPDRGEQDVHNDLRGGTSSALIRWVDARVSPLELLDELRPQTQMRRVGQGYLGWCPFHDGATRSC